MDMCKYASIDQEEQMAEEETPEDPREKPNIFVTKRPAMTMLIINIIVTVVLVIILVETIVGKKIQGLEETNSVNLDHIQRLQDELDRISQDINPDDRARKKNNTRENDWKLMTNELQDLRDEIAEMKMAALKQAELRAEMAEIINSTLKKMLREDRTKTNQRLEKLRKELNTTQDNWKLINDKLRAELRAEIINSTLRMLQEDRTKTNQRLEKLRKEFNTTQDNWKLITNKLRVEMAEMMKSADQQLNHSLRLTMDNNMAAFKQDIANNIKQTVGKQREDNAKALQRMKEEFLEPLKTAISGVKDRLKDISSVQDSRKHDISRLTNTQGTLKKQVNEQRESITKLQNKASLNVSGNLLLGLCSLLSTMHMYY